jgi:hypothetical protein
MSEYWKQDPRIEEDSAMRNLEKKVHYCMYMLAQAGIALDASNQGFAIPDDYDHKEVYFDGDEVRSSAKSGAK